MGPDGTAGTFFNSPGANLYPLLGNVRYMKYKAYLATTNSAATPTLNDVTVCYSNTNAPTAANGSVTGTITDASGAPISGVTINLSGTQSRETITDLYGDAFARELHLQSGESQFQFAGRAYRSVIHGIRER